MDACPTTPRNPRCPRRSGGLSGWKLLVLALGCATAYGVFLVLPCDADDLDAFPREDVAAGYHDPKDLWPLNNGLGGIVFGFGGLTTVLLGPAVTLVALSGPCSDQTESVQETTLRPQDRAGRRGTARAADAAPGGSRCRTTSASSPARATAVM
jgi:hypothetical protein